MGKFVKKTKFKIRRFFRENGKKVVIFLGGTLIMFFITMAIFPPLKNFVFSMFIVESIRVEGVEYNDVSDLENALEIYKGMVNWNIDREELKNHLKTRFKWIKRVAISNIPSKTLVLYIEEHEPIVFYRNKKGELWIVGENGKVLNRYYAKKFGYLYLPILQCDEKYIGYVVSRLQALKERKNGDDFFGNISEIVVKDQDSKWVIFLKNFKARIFVDPFGQFKNIEAFLKLKNRIIEDVGIIEYVDISFTNQIIVKKRI